MGSTAPGNLTENTLGTEQYKAAQSGPIVQQIDTSDHSSGKGPPVALRATTTTPTGTLTWPTTTDTMVGRATTDTLTNKTLTSPVINVGSDASGDMYYRNASGIYTRLPTGTGALLGGTPPTYAGTAVTNSLSGDVSLSNTGTYFDGPSMAQGSTGTWFATGTVTLSDTSAARMNVKLWDGTTIIASADLLLIANGIVPVSLSGFLASPAGNIRISVEDATTTAGKILFNASGNSKDSTISGFRIA